MGLPCHTHSHLRMPEKTGVVKAEALPRVPLYMGLVRRSCPYPIHLYLGPQSLTHTRTVVRTQLESWLTLAAKRAWQVHTSMLAISVATLVYVCNGGRGGVSRTQVRWGLSRPRQRPQHACLLLSFSGT